jgi:hypothetical protein
VDWAKVRHVAPPDSDGLDQVLLTKQLMGPQLAATDAGAESSRHLLHRRPRPARPCSHLGHVTAHQRRRPATAAPSDGYARVSCRLLTETQFEDPDYVTPPHLPAPHRRTHREEHP